MLTKEGSALNLREIRSGELILSDIFYGNGREFEFFAGDKSFYIFQADGQVNSWYIGDFDSQIPDWMKTNMAGALTGKTIENGKPKYLPQNDYLCTQKSFWDSLKSAPGTDEDAMFVMKNLIPRFFFDLDCK